MRNKINTLALIFLMFSTSFLMPSNAQMPARPPVAPPAAANQTPSPAPSNSGCSSNLDGCSNEGADCFINGQKGACKTTVVGGFPYGCQCSLPLPPRPPNNEERKTCTVLGCRFLSIGSSCEASEYQITAITSGVCCCQKPSVPNEPPNVPVAPPTNQAPAAPVNEAPNDDPINEAPINEAPINEASAF